MSKSNLEKDVVSAVRRLCEKGQRKFGLPLEEKPLWIEASTKAVVHEVQVCYGGAWLCRD